MKHYPRINSELARISIGVKEMLEDDNYIFFNCDLFHVIVREFSR